MGYFDSFKKELGRNTAKYVSNKFFGEDGWATPRRHLFGLGHPPLSKPDVLKHAAQELSAHEVKADDNEARKLNEQRVAEAQAYIKELESVHLTVARSIEWISTDEDFADSLSGGRKIPKELSHLFGSYELAKKDLVNRHCDHVRLFTLDWNLSHIGVNSIDYDRLVGALEDYHKVLLLSGKVWAYNTLTFRSATNDDFLAEFDLWWLELEDELDAYLENELDEGKNFVQRLFGKSSGPSELVQSFKSGLYDSILEDFQQNLDESLKLRTQLENVNTDLWFVALGMMKDGTVGEGTLRKFLNHTGYLDRFNVEGSLVEFGGIDEKEKKLHFDLMIDPAVQVPDYEVSSIYNGLRLKQEPFSRSRWNTLTKNFLLSSAIGLCRDIAAFNWNASYKVVVRVYAPVIETSKLKEENLVIECALRIADIQKINWDAIGLSEIESLSGVKMDFNPRSGFQALGQSSTS